jgi:hypothetical protein
MSTWYTLGDAKKRLFQLLSDSDRHEGRCTEPDLYSETRNAPHHPDKDGVVTVKCWNCDAQDHFLYKDP